MKDPKPVAAHESPWLVRALKRSGDAYRSHPGWHETTVRDSAVVAATRATLTALDGSSEPGVAIFGARPGPIVTLTAAGAARLHEDLTAILETLKDQP
jgi:hypothetical protein